MTAGEAITWMKQTNIYHRWLLPIGINGGTVFFGRPVGNLSEMMPMDCYLNKDHDDALVAHIFHTYHLENDDEKKPSLSIPKRGNSSASPVWEVVPTLERII